MTLIIQSSTEPLILLSALGRITMGNLSNVPEMSTMATRSESVGEEGNSTINEPLEVSAITLSQLLEA